MGGRFPACNPLDKYTEGPMPPIQDASPTSIFEFIDIGLVWEWEVQPGDRKLIAIPFDNEPRNPGSHEYLCTCILTSIAEITKSQDASVAAPRPSADATKSGHMPISFLVYNLTTEQADLVLQCKVWSSHAVTFCATRFAPTCPNFMFAIRGLGTISVKIVYLIVKQVWESDATKTYTQSLVNEALDDEKEKVKAELERVLKTMNIIRLDAKEAGNVLRPCFNVYADCTNISYDTLWSHLRTFLLNRSYTSSLEGQGMTEKIPFVCTNCHSVDHLRGLCPFPGMIGWNGPKRDIGGDTPGCRNGSNYSPDQHYPNYRPQPCT